MTDVKELVERLRQLMRFASDQKSRDWDEQDEIRNVFHSAFKTLQDAKAALEALSLSQGVAVKPLEWEPRQPEGAFLAVTEIGRYFARPQFEMFVWFLESVTKDGHGYVASIDEAKSAAQADYERRVLSALVMQPLSPAAIRAALPE